MFEAGAVDYLSKSMPQAEFLAAVEAILRRGGEGKGDQDRQ
jgi:DNA-binding response OmpR family regulator